MRWFVLLVAILALGALGCTRVVAGTDDVELAYDAEAVPPEATFGEDLRALVLRRLGAASISADVTLEGKSLRVVVDESLAPSVDELVTWTGTLLVYEPDPSVTLVPPAGHSLQARDGAWVGARVDVLRAAETWPIDREHRVLAEPLWETARGAAEPVYRTRVVKTIPIGELGEGVLVGWGDGGTLRLRVTQGTLGASVLHDAKARKETILARGRVALGPPKLEADAIVIGFGEGFESYARAQKEKALLTTPKLPVLHRTGAVGLPPNRVLSAACFVVPVLLSLAWLFFVRRFDRAHPEPAWLIAVTFLLGALVTVPAGLVELLCTRISPWLDPRLVTFGGQVFALPLAFVVLTTVVGLVEEGAKRLAATFATRRPEFDEPVDGIVYGIVASLGFAAAENVRYFAIGRMNAPLVIARCFMSIPAHMFFGALWGYALGTKLVDRRSRAWPWLFYAAAAHGLYDALLSTEGAGLVAVLLNVGLASAFVVLLRRALRHGVVTKEMLAIKPEDRLLFRVGRPRLFWLSALSLHLLAFGIFLLGAWHQLARHRPSIGFVVGSSIMLLLLAFAALGISWTLPLDVAIDDYGVTFAGAARAWGKIRSFAARKDHVELDCEGGPILLGPGTPEVVDAIAHELRERIGTGGADRTKTLESVES